MASKLGTDSDPKVLDALEKTESIEIDGFLEGMTTQQRMVMSFRRRGWSIRGIAKQLGLSATRIHAIVKEAREILAKQITEQTVAEHVSDAVSVYEEVEQEALNMMTNIDLDPNTKLRAMNTVLSARDKQVKLLMDLGFVERVAQKTETNVTVNVLQGWETELKRNLSAQIIESQLQPLEDPVALPEDAATYTPEPVKAKPQNEAEQLAELVGDMDFDDDDEEDD